MVFNIFAAPNTKFFLPAPLHHQFTRCVLRVDIIIDSKKWDHSFVAYLQTVKPPFYRNLSIYLKMVPDVYLPDSGLITQARWSAKLIRG
ncbi:hypothetical protein DN068_06095 [Taibaiella soli]|uniref:Uncharacterized protein n=1 Tax=Taibaiella soli TaxID=1649169 RepID=A0A2W2AF39_9BACT|nr:hypothetical protein DN068_06095 [Taibaiella soli]